MAVWRSALVWALLLSTVPCAWAKAKKRKAAKASAGKVSWQVLWNGNGADAAMQQLAAVDGLAKRGDTQGAQALLARISAREFGDYDEGAAASMLVARAATHSDFGEQQRLTWRRAARRRCPPGRTSSSATTSAGASQRSPTGRPRRRRR